MLHPKVLVFSQGLKVQQAVLSVLANCGISTIVASTVQESLAILCHQPVLLIFCSNELPGAVLEDFIRQTMLLPQRVPVVMVLRMGEWERSLRFLDAGALDCIVCPLDAFEAKRVTENVLDLVCAQKRQQTPRLAA